MTDVVNHPVHYSTGRFTCECIAITLHMTFCAGNAVKYIWRHREKNGVEDLRKAVVYLRWALEDHRFSVLPGTEKIVSELIHDHVAGPLRELPNEPAVYRALELIAVCDDYESALLLVEQAIAEYECAPIVLPADQFDQLMAEADQADIATKLAEAAVKPREFRTYGKPAQFGEPGTYLINGGDQECSGNSGIPCDTESGNFPNIAEAS